MSGRIESIHFIDDRTVSIEEAVAKMLGWMRTDKRITQILVTTEGIDRRQLISLNQLPEPLMDFITEEREWARLKLYEAAEKWFESTTSPDIPNEKIEELSRNATEREADLDYWNEIGEKAVQYLRAIDRTLSRKNGLLKADRSTPPRILTSSLHSWAMRQYKIDIDEQAPASNKAVSNHAQLIRLAILNSIKALGYDPIALPAEHTHSTEGIKAEVRHYLVTPESALFKPKRQTKKTQKEYETSTFNKHWHELLKKKLIVYLS